MKNKCLCSKNGGDPLTAIENGQYKMRKLIARTTVQSLPNGCCSGFRGY
jgi:hypothetical protein